MPYRPRISPILCPVLARTWQQTAWEWVGSKGIVNDKEVVAKLRARITDVGVAVYDCAYIAVRRACEKEGFNRCPVSLGDR